MQVFFSGEARELVQRFRSALGGGGTYSIMRESLHQSHGYSARPITEICSTPKDCYIALQLVGHKSIFRKLLYTQCSKRDQKEIDQCLARLIAVPLSVPLSSPPCLRLLLRPIAAGVAFRLSQKSSSSSEKEFVPSSNAKLSGWLSLTGRAC